MFNESNAEEQLQKFCNFYLCVQYDSDLGDMTLGQGHDRSLGHGQQILKYRSNSNKGNAKCSIPTHPNISQSWPWPLTPDLENQRPHSLILGNMYVEFYEDEQQYDLYGVQKVISIYVHCGLNLWPLNLKISRYHPPIVDIMCAKFDEDTLNSLVSMAFIRLFP